jgi:Fe-S-cluster containining protein
MSTLIEEWKNKKHQIKQQRGKVTGRLKQVPQKELMDLANDTHEEVFSEIDCLDCANCCSKIPPIVDNTDINRIAKTLGMKAANFRKQYTRIDNDGDTVLKTVPCTFLMEDNKCFIYDIRPKACRNYPHTEGYEFVGNLDLHTKNTQYCPAAYHIITRILKKVK